MVERLKYDAVWVRWHDAHFKVEVDESPSIVTDSMGWLVADRDDCVKLAQSAYIPENEDSEPAEVLTIPRGMVEFVRVVRAFNQPE